jgi:hypothetical protein
LDVFFFASQAAGAGFGTAQALESMSPFLGTGYTHATLYSSVTSPPIIVTTGVFHFFLFLRFFSVFH